MAKTRDYMDYLDERIEIAPANSQEEYQAAETIAEVLRDHDLETTIEEFDAYPLASMVGPVLACVLFVCLLVAGLTQGVIQILAILFAALAVGFPLFLHFSGMRLLDRFGPASQSQNVVAVHRATGSKVVKGARPIVVVAHYDTPRESILRRQPIARYQAAARIVTIPCSIAVAVSLLFQIMLFLPAVVRTFMWIVGLMAALPLLVLAIIDIIDHFAGCTVGANDNKSSVAALLSLASKVRPTGDRVDGDFEERENKPVRRRATDKPEEPPAPRRIEIVEEVKGVRHGAEVLNALGILPETCEVVYQEPRVQIVEQAPTEVLTPSDESDEPYESETATTSEGSREDSREADEPTLVLAEPAGTRDHEQRDASDSSEVADGDATDEWLAQETEEQGEPSGDTDAYDAPEDDSSDDEEFEEEYADADEYDEEEEYDEDEDEEYDEDIDYEDDEEEWEGSGGLAAVGAWFSERIASVREYLSRDRGSDIDIDRGDDRSGDDADESDEYDVWTDEYADDEYEEDEDSDQDLGSEDVFELEDEREDDAFEDEDAYDEDVDYEDIDYADEEEEPEDFDEIDEFEFEEDEPEFDEADEFEDEELEPEEDYADFEYDEDEFDENDVEGDFEDEYEDDEYEFEGEEDEAQAPSLVDRIVSFFYRSREHKAEYETEYEQAEEPDDEAYDPEDDYAYEDEELDEDLTLFAEDVPHEEEDDLFDEELDEDFESDETPEEDTNDLEDDFEGDDEFIDADLEFDDEVTYEAEAPADPNILHFDRDEDPDIAPRDTTGLDTISDSYDLYTGEVNRVSTREKPEPMDDPTWGVSSYQPARPVMNIARRAALFDLPDPSAASMDPFSGDSYDEDEYVEGLQVEDDDYIEEEPYDEPDESYEVANDEDAPEAEDVPEENAPDTDPTQTKFWGSSQSSDWKGGATVRADLRDDEEPVVIDADDLQDAILEMGDEFLVAHDIWFVATGASEVGHAGIRAFLDEHRRDIRGAFLINLDSIGAGGLSVLVREGLHSPRRADRRLVRMITSIAQDLHIQLETALYGWDERESATSMRSRVRSVTIAGLDENDLPALSHTSDDIPENVDPQQVSNVVRIVAELIRRS